jgi:hypothetical protein
MPKGCNLKRDGTAMAQAARLHDVTAESGLNPRPLLVGVVVDRVALVEGFQLVPFVCPGQYHSTNAPYSFTELSPMLCNLSKC